MTLVNPYVYLIEVNNCLISINNGTKAQNPIYNEATANEPRHEISKNMACATSRALDRHVHTRSLIRAFASRLNIL